MNFVPCFLYVFSGETSVRDESCGDLVFCFKPKMAAPITENYPCFDKFQHIYSVL